LLDKNCIYEDGGTLMYNDYFTGDASNHYDGEEYFLDVQLEEGKTYSIFVAIHTSILFKGHFGSQNSNDDLIFADLKFWLDNIKIEYHNPPPSPPADEHSPEVDSLQGPEFLTIGHDGVFTATATDADEDNLFYKFDWDDGTTSEWTTSRQMTHKYEEMGEYYVRVQVKDDSEYMLKSELSESLKVFVRYPQGTIYLDPSIDNSNWIIGSTYSIKWEYTEEIGDDMIITLHKKSDPDFIMKITEEPVPSDVVYQWKIPSNIVPGDGYQIAIWNSANYSISGEFSIVKSKSSSLAFQNIFNRFMYKFPVLTMIVLKYAYLNKLLNIN
jgi:hypothetical protein